MEPDPSAASLTMLMREMMHPIVESLTKSSEQNARALTQLASATATAGTAGPARSSSKERESTVIETSTPISSDEVEADGSAPDA